MSPLGGLDSKAMVPPVVYHEGFYLPMGRHVFPSIKYKLIAERLVADGVLADADLLRPETIPLEDVYRTHDRGYIDRLLAGTIRPDEERKMELRYSRALVDATLLGCGGTLLAANLALENGRAASVIGGGFHHTHRGHGEGFCILHDMGIVLEKLAAEGRVTRSMVVDLDVHQGNGTASLFPPEAPGKASAGGVFTVSLHQENLYPRVKPPSSIDVGLDYGLGDEAYLDTLARTLDAAFVSWRPELLVYVAGADPYEHDKLGGLCLTIPALAARDRMVFERARRESVPVVSVFAGGYAENTADTVTIHVNTLLAAREVFGGDRP